MINALGVGINTPTIYLKGQKKMKELIFRKLKPSEIEVRIGSTSKKTFTLLLYKDARVDMALLDEVVGKGRWQREHKILGNDIYCRVGIYNEELNQFVWYEDAGSSGSIEVEKSKASDSFKRACVNVGIGRELYTAPEIKIWKKDENDDSYKYNSYFVKEIDYKDNEISKLIICDEKTGEVVFSYPKGVKVAQTNDSTPKNTNTSTDDIKTDLKGSIRPKEKGLIEAYLKTLNGTQSTKFFAWLDEKCGTMSINLLSAEQGIKIVKAFKLEDKKGE